MKYPCVSLNRACSAVVLAACASLLSHCATPAEKVELERLHKEQKELLMEIERLKQQGPRPSGKCAAPIEVTLKDGSKQF